MSIDKENRALRVELIFDRDCSNVEDTRHMIQAALRETGMSSAWTEWDRSAPGTPDELRNYGSPTVLVNGRDVVCAENDNKSAQSDANSCRVYASDRGGLCGAPPAELIAGLIREVNEKS